MRAFTKLPAFARRSPLGSFRTCVSSASRIAIVDLSPFASNGNEGSKFKAAQELSSAFADTGFAVVVGHGVPQTLTQELRRSALSFFSMDLQEKMKTNEGWGSGYGNAPYCYMEENGAQLLGDFNRPNDIVESLWYVGLSKPEVERALPSFPADLGSLIVSHEAHIANLRSTLNVASELALGLEEGFLREKCDIGNETLRLAHYPEQEVPPLEGQMRYGAHVDSYGITVLNLDDEHPEGLQVMIDETWTDIPFVEHSFVLNVGACLSRWTNGFWKASVHRVLNYPGRRLSIVTNAVKPTEDIVIEPIGPVAKPAKYPPILMADFTADRVAMHRPTYVQEKMIDDVASVGEQIRNYQR